MHKNLSGRYLKNNGDNCPWCKSEDLASSSLNVVDVGVYEAEVTCMECRKVWKDVIEEKDKGLKLIGVR